MVLRSECGSIAVSAWLLSFRALVVIGLYLSLFSICIAEILLSPPNEVVHPVEVDPSKPVLVSVTQIGVDLSVCVIKPSGSEECVNSPGERNGVERLLIESKIAGQAKVRVVRNFPAAAAGKYAIEFSDLPLAHSLSDYRRLHRFGVLFHEATLEAKERGVAELQALLDSPVEQALAPWIEYYLADIFRDSNQFDLALLHYERALRLWQTRGNSEMTLAVRRGQAFVLREQGKYQESQALSVGLLPELAQQVSLDKAFLVDESMVRGNICLDYLYIGDFDKAEVCYLEPFSVGDSTYPPLVPLLEEQLQDAELIGLAANNLGAMYMLRNEYDSAISFYEKAIEQYKRIGDRKRLSRAHSNLGITYRRWGEITTALNHYLVARDYLAGTGDDKRLGQILHNMGQLYLSVGDLPASVTHLNEALRLREAVKDQDGAAFTLKSLGNATRDLGDAEEALAFHRRALELNQRLNRTGRIAANLVEIAADQFALGDYEEAQVSLKEAEQHLSDSDPRLLGRSFIVRADVLDALERRDDADANLALALKQFENIDYVPGQIDALTRRGRVALAAGDWKRAESALEAGRSLHLSIKGRVQSASLGASYLSRIRAMYVNLVTAILRQSRSNEQIVRALRIAEESRAESLRAGHREIGDLATSDELLDLRRALSANNYRLQRALADGEVGQQKVEAARVDFYETLARIEAKTSAKADVEQNSDWQVPDYGVATIEYLVSDDVSHAFLLQNGETTVFDLPGRLRIAGPIRELHEKLQSPGARADEELSLLFELVMQPMVTKIQGDSLVIIPDDVLGYLPFAALNTSRDRYRALLEDFTISYSASLEMVGRKGVESPSSNEGVAIVADPVFDVKDSRLSGMRAASTTVAGTMTRSEDWVRLLWSETESRRLLDLFSSDQVSVVTGFDAGKDILTTSAFKNARLLHIASHAFADSSSPLSNGSGSIDVDARWSIS